MTEDKVKKTAVKKAPAKAASKPSAPKAAKSGKKIKVTQIASVAGRGEKQLATLIGLGLNKIRRSKVLEDTPSVRGMVEKVKHLVVVEDAA